MSCICEICGKPNDDCHFRICVYCHIEGQDEVGKNLTLGGRFYKADKVNPTVIAVKDTATEHKIDTTEHKLCTEGL